jgi:hypothetical protein
VDAFERKYDHQERDEVLMATCIKKAPRFILSDDLESSPLKLVNKSLNEQDTPSANYVIETEPAANLENKINFSQWNPDN